MANKNDGNRKQRTLGGGLEALGTLLTPKDNEELRRQEEEKERLRKLALEEARKPEREQLQAKLDQKKLERLHSLHKNSSTNDTDLRRRLVQERKNKIAREGIKKHASKAAGVKSVFRLNKDGELFMTSFGKGNEAEAEKLVMDKTVTTISEVPAYAASVGKKQIRIEGHIVKNAQIDNPLLSKKAPGSDLIGMRDKIEERFFGRTYEDNIHIQLAHNIQDIEKILAVHINNIIYEINNMLREDEVSFGDIIGSLGVSKT